jgi:hypothetical protein
VQDRLKDPGERAVTGRGRGQFHAVDPRTGREPAGSSLLARDSAVRQAQETAFRAAVAALLAGAGHGAPRRGERIDEFVERDLVPRSRDFIERRWVVEESRDDAFYLVTMSVVFDTAAIGRALEQFIGSRGERHVAEPE